MRALLVVTFFAILFTLRAPAEEKPTLPNVLMIVTDDQGWNDVGYRNPKVMTPNIDKLAKTGLRLENYYVFSTCSPTRAALLTGRNPSRFGILNPIAGKSKQALPDGTLTLAKLLNQKNYETNLDGKWHLGLRPEVGPRAYGFDASYGYLHGQIDPIRHRYKLGDKTWHRNEKFLEEKGHVTDLITDEAVRVIKKPRKNPFFLYVAYHSPHTPFVEDQKWIDLYKDKFKQPSRQIYLASITHLDAGIGKILKALSDTKQRENTLIIFTSDNGGQKSGKHAKHEYGGRYGPYPVLADNGKLRGWKGDVYEGGIHVPAVVNWPKKIQPGACRATLCGIDWLPTLAAITGAKIPKNANLDGEDAWPLLRGTKETRKGHLFWHTRNAWAIREGDWKLVLRSPKQPKLELFHLKADPFEKENLVKKHPKKADQLHKKLRREIQSKE